MYKYLVSGRAVSVVEDLVSGFLVQNVYSDEDNQEEYIDENTYFVKHVFDTAPTDVYEEKIRVSQEAIRKLSEERGDLDANLRSMKKETKEIFEKFETVEALKPLFNYISGKVFCYFVPCGIHSSPDIVGLDGSSIDSISVKEEEKKQPMYPRMVMLSGNDRGGLIWNFKKGRYQSDDDYYRVIPCASYEEAVGMMKERLIEMIKKSNMPAHHIITKAKFYDIALPIEYIERYYTIQTDRLEKDVASYTITIKDKKDEIAKVILEKVEALREIVDAETLTSDE